MKDSFPFRFSFPRSHGAKIQIVLLSIIACVFLLSSYLSIKSIGDLLDREAERLARQWADTFISQVQSVDRILQGGTISEAEAQKFQRLAAVGEVFRFKIFAPDGTLRLVSDELDKTGKADSLAGHQPDIAAAILAGQVHVEVKDGRSKSNRPDAYAEAYVPLIENGDVKGVVEVYVDQTDQRAHYGATLWRTIWMTLALTVLAFGYTIYSTILLRRERRSDAQARYLSRHDVLTGVANRAVFNEKLTSAFDGRYERDGDLAVLMIDLDGFKSVNDMQGHAVGDSVLRAVGQALAEEIRPGDVLARLGGDEFAILLHDVRGKNSVRRFAERLVRSIRNVKVAGNKGVRVSASLGLALARDVSEDAQANDLLKRSDVALYQAKENGRDRAVIFQPGMEAILHARNALRERVIEAVEAGDLIVYYQPQHNATDGALTGFEALVRLPDGNGGFIPPDEFIPVAEDLGLMDRLGAIVLEAAARQAATWPHEIGVAVNLFAQQFENDLVPVVRDILKRTGLSAKRLELEITESLFIANTAHAVAQLHELKRMGVRIAMDDFGTGYSSLSYLWQFPFDRLKVDRSCFERLKKADEQDTEQTRVLAVLDTISAMGKAMDLRVTAEGIETPDQINYARKVGYHDIQGYFYSKPMPDSELAAYVLKNFGSSEEKPSKGESRVA